MTIEPLPPSSCSGALLLDRNDLAGLTLYLRSKDWIAAQETVCRAESAGEGNMNYTLRIQTTKRSFILKQARPWVEKYPGIPAPCSRAEMEAHFYETVLTNGQIAQHMPKLLGYDARNRVLMLQDLVLAQDFTFLYRDTQSSFDEADLGVLTHYLVALHRSFRDLRFAEEFSNTEMRALNHEHIFVLPLRSGDGLDLDSITPGLRVFARQLQSDSLYLKLVRALGDRYLDNSSGRCLIHGDYFPGSWLKTGDRVYVIDPEFCFFGPPEWDLGVMVAHLYLAGISNRVIQDVSNLYIAAASINISLARQFAGVEIMRRLIGVAQLPLRYGLDEKQRLLQLSRELVLN
jgi:5-methylthioribose kinase